MSTIRVKCTDQMLTVAERPRIASGGVYENHVAFDFCEMWDGYSKIGVFYNVPFKPYKNAIDENGICTIPPEVTVRKGNMYFGVVGVNKAGIKRTTEVIPYFVDEGADDGNAVMSNPTQEIWQQCLAEIANAVTATQEAREAVAGVIGTADDAKRIAQSHANHHARTGDDPIEPSDIGAAEENHEHEFSEIKNHEHAQSHATGGTDPLTPESIGAAEIEHEHFASEVKNLPVFDQAYVDEEGTLHVQGFTPGEKATLPEMYVGTVETLSAGSRATAEIGGTVERPMLNLGIPEGKQGPQGPKGEPGKGFTLIGYFHSLDALKEKVTSPEVGDNYGVGLYAPYNIFSWDGNDWVDNGQLQGAKGETGEKGEKGDKGDTGSKGEPGVSPTVTVKNVSEDGKVIGKSITITDAEGPKTFHLRNGDDGPQGPKGDKGDTGAKGDKGDKGDTGATGAEILYISISEV